MWTLHVLVCLALKRKSKKLYNRNAKKTVSVEELLLCSNECVFFWPYLHVTFDFSQLVLDVFQRHGNYIITAVISTVVDWERARGRPPQVNSTWLRAYT